METNPAGRGCGEGGGRDGEGDWGVRRSRALPYNFRAVFGVRCATESSFLR